MLMDFRSRGISINTHSVSKPVKWLAKDLEATETEGVNQTERREEMKTATDGMSNRCMLNVMIKRAAEREKRGAGKV